MNEHVRGFDSVEDMFVYMRENEQQANARLAPDQQALDWGDHFVVFVPEDRLVIFGHCLSLAEVMANEARAMGQMGTDPDSAEGRCELEETRARMVDAHHRGYLFGWHYSIVEPEGELGSTHKVNAWPIPERLFAAARAVRWLPGALDDLSLVQLDAAYQAMRAHILHQP